MTKNFDIFFNNLKSSIMKLEDFVNYDKAFLNVNKNLEELQLLNQVLKSETPVEELQSILEQNPNVKNLIPNLIAIRGNIINTVNESIEINEKTSIDDILELINKVGLIKFFKEKKITNIIDYLIGLEIGMDTNARKNRVGSLMENECERILNSKSLNFRKQIGINKLEKIFPDIDFNEVRDAFNNKKANKIFDFLIEYNEKYYLMEVNFYGSSGSKLNETAKSYMFLENKLKKYENIEFIWVTDGLGWNSTKKQIEEAYENIEFLFNLKEFESNSFSELVGD